MARLSHIEGGAQSTASETQRRAVVRTLTGEVRYVVELTQRMSRTRTTGERTARTLNTADRKGEPLRVSAEQGEIMGIESEASKDLELQDEDAEAVVGGSKQKKKTVTKHIAHVNAGSTIPSSLTESSTGRVVPPDASGDDSYLTGQ
jgi:hypothetical protein